MRDRKSELNIHILLLTYIPSTNHLDSALQCNQVIPMYISPMLLETASNPFSDPNFIYEPKIDGHRLIYANEAGQTRLYTRHENDVTTKYPELQHGPEDVVLDGEVACVDPVTGQICFETLMERFAARRAEKIRRMQASHPVSYIVFDVLQHQGKDLTHLPLERRKEILAGLGLSNPHMTVIPYVDAEGEDLYKTIQQRGMEGIVAKRKGSRYMPGRRSEHWQKIINWTYVDVVITGYRKSEFGWYVAIEENGVFRPAGIIELGVTPTHRRAFYGVCHQLVIREDEDIVHLQPRIRAQVKIRNMTRAGMLRSPSFVKFLI